MLTLTLSPKNEIKIKIKIKIKIVKSNILTSNIILVYKTSSYTIIY